ncbi:MAG: ABC transporter substrate-binding protein [Gemmatimonadota bacterium]
MAAAACLLAAAASASGPYRDLSTAGSGFLGAGRELADPDTLTAVRLGVTAPAGTAAGRELLEGVRLAVEEANAGGGYGGLPFAVVYRADDGPWGVVARQVADLSEQDSVWLIIGSLDGERAHAAELVAAKLWVPVITPAGDHTIDYANVPWVLRGMPDDLSQVELLLDAADRRGWRRLVVVSELWRDARQGADRLERRALERGFEVVLRHPYEPYRPAAEVDRVARAPADAVVVWGRPLSAVPLIRQLRDLGVAAPLLLPALLAVPEVAALDGIGPALVAAPYDLDPGPGELSTFCRRWRERTGAEPSYLGVLAYDLTRYALAAVRRAGLNRARIRDALTAGGFEGLSGPFAFNSLGGRLRAPVLMAARDGLWASADSATPLTPPSPPPR